VEIPAPAPLTKQAQRTQVSPGPQVPLRGLAYEVGALGAQPGRSTDSLDGARTVDYSHARGSMQSVDAPSSMSERLSRTAACVLVGGMTLAVPGATYRRRAPPSSGSEQQWAGENVCRGYTNGYTAAERPPRILSETASDLLFPVGMTGFEPAAP